jgi:hypothetical protein
MSDVFRRRKKGRRFAVEAGRRPRNAFERFLRAGRKLASMTAANARHPRGRPPAPLVSP